MRTLILSLAIAMAGLCSFTTTLSADILATGFFSGTIERFDAQTLNRTTFATIATAQDPFPGLAGIAVDSTNNRVLVSGRVSNQIYELDLAGNLVNVQNFTGGSQPAGMTIDSSGNLFVASNGGNTVTAYDPNWNIVDTITLPDVGVGDNLPNGLAFDSQGRLLISTFAGAGLFRYDPVSGMTTNIFSNPLANGQVGVDADDNIYVGGAAFSNNVLKLDAADVEVGSPFLTIDDSFVPQPNDPYTSPDFTSPTGIAFDDDGNLIVGALGRTNPTSVDDSFQSNGRLLRFTTGGAFIDASVPNTTPLSAVAWLTTPIPEPHSLLILGGFAGIGLLRRRRTSRVG